MDADLTYLLGRCKASITITVNPHRDVYQSAREWIDEQREREPDGNLDLAPDIEAEMVSRNAVVEIQAYPDTPVGFYTVLHYDLALALSHMATIIMDSDRDVADGKVVRVQSFDELNDLLRR